MKRQIVLVPVDGSERSEAAIPLDAALARASGAGLELFAVVDSLGTQAPAQRLETLVARGLESHLHAVGDRLRAHGLVVEIVVRYGSPAEEILIHAQKRRARAVVMATRGLGNLDRRRIGSVADAVARLAPCPVLVVRPGRAATACPP